MRDRINLKYTIILSLIYCIVYISYWMFSRKPDIGVQVLLFILMLVAILFNIVILFYAIFRNYFHFNKHHIVLAVLIIIMIISAHDLSGLRTYYRHLYFNIHYKAYSRIIEKILSTKAKSAHSMNLPPHSTHLSLNGKVKIIREHNNVTVYFIWSEGYGEHVQIAYASNNQIVNDKYHFEAIRDNWLFAYR